MLGTSYHIIHHDLRGTVAQEFTVIVLITSRQAMYDTVYLPIIPSNFTQFLSLHL